jgi:SAM-dependent methyltransferase
MSESHSGLKAGDPHYMAYVGPPAQYDFMGATQFRLLCSLGLRARHRLLDFGCGSLRAGRFFLSYLDKGNYYGVEPNGWLVEEAIAKEIGADLVRLKEPHFEHGDDFTVNFPEKFDFILAQSIFSHTGADLAARGLASFCGALAEGGVIAATFVVGRKESQKKGWLYPDCLTFRDRTIRCIARGNALQVRRISWYHPRQSWYLFAREKERLPGFLMSRHLSGAVLFDPDFRGSWNPGWRLFDFARKVRSAI